MKNIQGVEDPVISLPPIGLNIDVSNLDEIIDKMKTINDLSSKVTNVVPVDDYLLKQSEVAKILGINQVTVGRLIKNGHLKGIKLGSTKVRKKEVDRFMHFLEETGESLEDIYS
jgi:excisionase family DNA binding protein